MRTLVLTLLLAGLATFGTADSVADERLATIRLPDGFVIEPFAEVPNARSSSAPAGTGVCLR